MDDNLPQSLEQEFNVDDAFDEGEDDDISPHGFTSAVIRAELARSLSLVETVTNGVGNNDASSSKAIEEPNASVSTIDIDGPEPSSSLPPPPEYPSPQSSYFSYDSNPDPVSLQFSQISLSDGPILYESPVELEPYPSVHIEVSEGEESRVQVVKIINEVEEADVFQSPSSASPATEPSEFQHTHSPRSSAPSDASRHVLNMQSPSNASSHSISPSLSAPDHQRSEIVTKHRPTRSASQNVLDKVYSRTRPTFLPPKTLDEDRKHLAVWEHMMKESRAVETKKRKEREESRLQRERRAEELIHIWNKNIISDWKVVNRDPLMRKLWWRGIPTKLRAGLWERAVGNPLALSKDTYRSCLARAKRALAAGTFPSTSLSMMDKDIRSTLPTLHLFHPDTGAMYGELKDMLCAWVISRSDEGLGYTMGISKIAAMFLLNMPLPEGFVAMRNLLERHCMRSFYGGPSSQADMEAYYRIFDTLLADAMPKIYFNFKQHQLSPASYLADWLIPLFLDHLELNACAHIWDVLLLEGDSFLFRAALGLLSLLEPRLFFPDRQELLEVLKAENKAALEIARRENIPLDGPKYDIYGVDESTLWEKIDSMDEWWKDSTWTRLLLRELPDL